MQHTFFKSPVLLLLCFGFSSLSGISQERNPKPVKNKAIIKTEAESTISCWLTNPDKSALLQKQDLKIPFNAPVNQYPTINIDAATTYQEMDGFGIALTGGSASLIANLAPEIRDTLLRELFLNNDNSIGISYLRISIGASDLDANVFSYNDLPSGETDVQLKKFDLGPDKTHLIPVLKSILKLNPEIKIMASPWSAPVWMKNNKNSIGGSLLPEYYDAYAKYFVRYIKGMKAEGIPIDAITIQNEPLYGGNNPSMVMPATEQRDFIKNNLGPAFKAAGIKTKIILYDHNCDVPEYATDILSDSNASQYIDGSAFHLYGGDISALSKVHDAYPAKNLYFTEQWVGGPSKFGPDMKWYVQNVIIGSTRNWSKAVIEWNLASDSLYNPHTPGGCTSCEGAITISSGISRNVSYYTLAHASKFVPAGSVRIASDSLPTLPNVAFITPGGRKVMIVLNISDKTETFNIAFKRKTATCSLSSGSVATYVW